MIRRRALLAATLSAAFAQRARASGNGVLTVLVGAPEGSATDVGARAFAPFLERYLPGVQVAIANRPGEAGLTAFRALAAADPAAFTVGWIATPSLPARTVDRAGAATLLDRLRLIASVQKEPIALVSAADSPLASAQEVIARSSENADAMPLGTPPAGSPPHLAALRLQALAGTKLNIVAFPSAAAARQAAVSGNLEAAILGLADAIESLRGGRLNGLGIAARTRSDAFPDMPPLRDSGVPLSAFIHRGIGVPVAMREADCARLRGALDHVVADPEFRTQGESSGFAVNWIDGPAWTAQASAEREDLARLWESGPWQPSGVG